MSVLCIIKCKSQKLIWRYEHWPFDILSVKADWPHLRDYPHTPTDCRQTGTHFILVMILMKVVGLTVQRDGRTDRQMDRCHKVHYLPRFAVNKNGSWTTWTSFWAEHHILWWTLGMSQFMRNPKFVNQIWPEIIVQCNESGFPRTLCCIPWTFFIDLIFDILSNM